MYQQRTLEKGPGGKQVLLEDEIERLMQDSRSQVAILGESGVGKSALIKHVAMKLNLTLWPHACLQDDTLDSILGEFDRNKVTGSETERSGQLGKGPFGIGRSKKISAEARHRTFAHTLRELMWASGLQVLVLENFHKIKDATMRSTIEDAMEFLHEDGDGRAQLYICGIGEDLVSSLLHNDFGVQRRVRVFPVKPMQPQEIQALYKSGFAILGLACSAALLRSMTSVSLGFPYIAQKLGLLTSESALERGSDSINSDDLAFAMRASRVEYFELELGRYRVVADASSAKAELLMLLAADETKRSWFIDDVEDLWRAHKAAQRSRATLRKDMNAFGDFMRKATVRGRPCWSFVGPATLICLRFIAQEIALGFDPLSPEYSM